MDESEDRDRGLAEADDGEWAEFDEDWPELSELELEVAISDFLRGQELGDAYPEDV